MTLSMAARMGSAVGWSGRIRLPSLSTMGMTNPAVAATQFTAFMAMGNVAISYGNFWQGIVADRFDYAMVLYLDALVMLVPLAIIPFLRNREPEAALAIEASAA